MLELRSGRPRVLVVDDEAEIRGLLYELLGEGYDCTPAASAEEALSKLDAATFDLVLSDIQMGGMSGLEMIPHVLAKSPDTVVVMVSGMQTIESAVGAMRVGAFDYVIKPFELPRVEAAVSRALNTAACASPSAATRATSKNSSAAARRSWTAPSVRSKTPTARRSRRSSRPWRRATPRPPDTRSGSSASASASGANSASAANSRARSNSARSSTTSARSGCPTRYCASPRR